MQAQYMIVVVAILVALLFISTRLTTWQRSRVRALPWRTPTLDELKRVATQWPGLPLVGQTWIWESKRGDYKLVAIHPTPNSDYVFVYELRPGKKVRMYGSLFERSDLPD